MKKHGKKNEVFKYFKEHGQNDEHQHEENKNYESDQNSEDVLLTAAQAVSRCARSSSSSMREQKGFAFSEQPRSL